MGYTVYMKMDKKALQAIKPETNESFKADFVQLMGLFEVPKFDGNETSFDKLESSQDPYESEAKVHCRWKEVDDVMVLRGPHEWFCQPHYDPESYSSGEFRFTKTNRKSYDGLVKVCYLLAQKHFGGSLSHDGNDKDFLTECREYIQDKDWERMQQALEMFGLSGDMQEKKTYLVTLTASIVVRVEDVADEAEAKILAFSNVDTEQLLQEAEVTDITIEE